MQSSQVAKWLLRRFVFLIPAESGEKITLGISTMLNMTVFLMTVMQGLPATDQTPIISKQISTYLHTYLQYLHIIYSVKCLVSDK